jgi:hypothetical protein
MALLCFIHAFEWALSGSKLVSRRLDNFIYKRNFHHLFCFSKNSFYFSILIEKINPSKSHSPIKKAVG